MGEATPVLSQEGRTAKVPVTPAAEALLESEHISPVNACFVSVFMDLLRNATFAGSKHRRDEGASLKIPASAPQAACLFKLKIKILSVNSFSECKRQASP